MMRNKTTVYDIIYINDKIKYHRSVKTEKTGHRKVANFKTFYLCSRSIPKAFLVGSFDLQLKTILNSFKLRIVIAWEKKRNKIYHLESRWHNSHVLDCIGLSWMSWPFTNPPFGSCAIYFHHGVNQNKFLYPPPGAKFSSLKLRREKNTAKTTLFAMPLTASRKRSHIPPHGKRKIIN